MRVTANSPQGKWAKVLFEGQDISQICIWADDEKGQAGIVVFDPNTRKPLVKEGKFAHAVLNGHIEIQIGRQ